MSSMAMAAPSTLATSAGSSVVDMGGTAADAAVAMALVAMCTEPGVCAPGAGGFVTVDPRDGSPVVVDGYVAVPGIGFDGELSTELISMEYGGGVTTAVGPGSIAVPGSFAALSVVSERYGRIPWSEVLHLVAELIEPGFPLSQACRIYLVDSGTLIFDKDPATRTALFEGDRLKEAGETVHIDNLATTLRQIGDEGAATFYRGALARQIAVDLAERGSMLTFEDMASYQPIIREPLKTKVSGWRVVSNPPPAVGGMAVVGALRKVADSDEPLAPDSWLDAMVEMSLLRREYEGADDPDGAALRLMERVGVRSPSTITVAAVDMEGTAVSATFSAGYGSGVIPTGTGLLMNNSVGEIELVSGGTESLVPGKRMMSNMAPTTVRSGSSVVGIGSPGADRITSALAITLIRFLLTEDSLSEAIEHPRLHVERIDPVEVAAETGLDLRDADVRWYPERHMFFGGVNSAGLVNGELVAHADSRRVGSAIVI